MGEIISKGDRYVADGVVVPDGAAVKLGIRYVLEGAGVEGRSREVPVDPERAVGVGNVVARAGAFGAPGPAVIPPVEVIVPPSVSM